jgi:hypothetical protein
MISLAADSSGWPSYGLGLGGGVTGVVAEMMPKV